MPTKDPERRREIRRQCYRRNLEKEQERARTYYHDNREYVLAQKKKQREDPATADKVREQRREGLKRWREKQKKLGLPTYDKNRFGAQYQRERKAQKRLRRIAFNEVETARKAGLEAKQRGVYEWNGEDARYGATRD